ncbi:hypothetical protein JNUCC1_03500 [Lentibacillus sp. JNUCC-1]|uniref:DUF2624 family protein n=1 Tax=Lentibacillus sp. JNUCC-1 TaxID=2654513 RepID=UPI0012E742F2|nr:DUF2624 family protein [Lentibacillus sp. JNUCC-1]MUV39622.1 hypothetical protein [Lentibacillus sp. JNUCC-1]
MNDILKTIMMGKLKSLSEKELMGYARQYGFNLTQQEAQDMIAYIKQNQVDPFSEQGRTILFNDLASITDRQTAQKAERLFREIIKTYGIDHMF